MEAVEGAVPAPRELEPGHGGKFLARCGHAASWPACDELARYEVHTGRAADADDLMEHRALSADHGGRPAAPGCADPGLADQSGSAGREPEKPRQPAAPRRSRHAHLDCPPEWFRKRLL